MKLVEVEINERYNLKEDSMVLHGYVVFRGDVGEMRIPLTAQDIEDIEQLLRVKTKALAQEA
jgi:hypothetical protein